MNVIKPKLKLILFVVIVLLLMILNYIFGWSEAISVEAVITYFDEMVANNFWQAALVYTIVTIIGCVVLALPGMIFAISAGAVFGPWLGTILCSIATTIGAALAFLVGRYFLKDAVKPLVSKSKILTKLLFSDNDKTDLILLLITRMLPIFPYNIQNFAYGITDISFSKYTVYTFFFMLPGIVLFTVGTAGVMAGGEQNSYFIIAGTLLLLMVALGVYLKKRYLKA